MVTLDDKLTIVVIIVAIVLMAFSVKFNIDARADHERRMNEIELIHDYNKSMDSSILVLDSLILEMRGIYAD